jgi:hypothetical protein
MQGFFALPGAGAGFFFSAWLTMMFWGIVAPEVGLKTIGYPLAMLVTIALWLIVAPAVTAIMSAKK